MHRFCGPGLLYLGHQLKGERSKEADMKLSLGASGLIRLALLAGLGLSLLVGGCASAASQTADNATGEKPWGQCDRSRLVNVTFVCYQR